MKVDYRAIEATLEAQRAARDLPPELVADVRGNGALGSRADQSDVLNFLRAATPEDREGFHHTLREIRERWDADQAELDALWETFGGEADRRMAREWWDEGASLAGIARRFSVVYDADVSPALLATWPAEGHWRDR